MFIKTQETINGATASYISALTALRDQLKAELATVEMHIDVCRKFADTGTCEPAAPVAVAVAKPPAPNLAFKAMGGTVARNAEGRPVAAPGNGRPAAHDDLEQRLSEALQAEPDARQLG